MSPTEPPIEDQDAPDAVVHALLAEEFARDDDVTATSDDVMRRFAADEGPAAAVRAQEAATAARTRSWLQRRWQLLCAAAALLATSAFFVPSWWQPDDPQRAGAQDPQPEERDQPIPIVDVANLKKLAARVQRITFEVLVHPDADLPFRVALAGPVLELQQKLRQTIVDDLRNDVEATSSALAERQTRVRCHLDDGRFFELAMSPYEADSQHVRLHPNGMDADLFAGTIGSAAWRQALATATNHAKQQLGVVTGPRDLATMPTERRSLRLFGLSDKQLAGLSRFPKLERLDCSGLRATIRETGLRHIERSCPELRELDLSGARFDDNDMACITDMVKLTKLTLRGVRGFTGRGFTFYLASAKWRDGPTHIDLRDVPTLTDSGLKRICRWDPIELLLDGSGEQITAAGFAEFNTTKKLQRLSLRGWFLPKSWGETLRALRSRSGLTILE